MIVHESLAPSDLGRYAKAYTEHIVPVDVFGVEPFNNACIFWLFIFVSHGIELAVLITTPMVFLKMFILAFAFEYFWRQVIKVLI